MIKYNKGFQDKIFGEGVALYGGGANCPAFTYIVLVLYVSA
jgi:hypothetical protein